MKYKKRILSSILVLVFLLLTISGPALQGIEKNDINILNHQDIGNWKITVDVINLEESDYRGLLKVYVIEPISRWNESWGSPYRFALLDFAYDSDIEVSDSLTKEISWNPFFIGNVDKDNIMVIAVLFNEHSEVRYSNPNNQQRKFDAYFTDASAAATPETIGYNRVTDEFTHTVFIEKGSTSGCSPCTKASEALSIIYESNDYPFYYVSMVSDKSTVAHTRLRNDFNIGAYPTTYFDGGYQLQVGSFDNLENTFRSYIQACGQREVPQVSLSVSLVWDPDVYPPMVTITKPEAGLYIANEKKRDIPQTIVVGAVDVEVQAYDEDSEIEKVEFYVNGQLRSEDSFYPYKFRNWKEYELFGRYTLRVVLYDQAGNMNIDEIQVIRFF
ncbi:MAG: Ig-like domain-containing protein [Candidatus Thermoplasmatota archaeon]|nr:Ig-like domain-containing protein [Candidatus Thermoplasmatota archaeon]